MNDIYAASFSSKLLDMINLRPESTPTTVSLDCEKRRKKKVTEDFLKISTWCLLHSFGLILSQVAKSIREPLQPDCPNAKQSILSPVQKALVTQPLRNRKPVLIMGSTGTGKTFTALEKINNIFDCGLLSADAKAIYIVKSSQLCLSWWLKKKLAVFGELVEVAMADSFKSLMKMLEDTTTTADVKYVFVDQLEDFIDPNTDVFELLKLLRLTLLDRFELMWILWNGKAKTYGHAALESIGRDVIFDCDHVPKGMNDDLSTVQGSFVAS